MDLREWTVLYVQHKDVLLRELEGYTEEGDRITFSFKNHELLAFPWERLSVPDASGKVLVVTLQTEENISFLINHWQEFAAHPDLTVVFANPDLNEKWSLRPAAHARIAEGNIEQGIRSLAQGVPTV